jgi:NAD(P)H-dependent FMN reductase
VLLVGSAKPAGTSTSEALGRYLFARLAERRVATTVLFVGRSPASHAERRLVAALADANLFVLATPVYVDSLPYPVTRTLEYVSQSLPRGAHLARLRP